MANTTPIRILAIDGGGIRGIIPGKVLVALEKKLKARYPDKPYISDHFDLIAGTSTGGILTCAYLLPDKENKDRPRYSAERVVSLYLDENKGGKIFKRSVVQQVKSIFGLTGSKYSAKNLEQVLRDEFGDAWLKDLLRPCLVTSYDITHRNGHFFKQQEAVKTDKTNYNFLVRSVARATSAGPTYFPCPNIEAENGDRFPLVDGGVFVSNPSLCAYAEARKLWEKGAKDMIILSLGTGTHYESYPWKKARRWGKVGWLRPVIDCMRGGVREVVDYQMTEIFTSADALDNYLRIDARLPDDIKPDMDAAKYENRMKLAKFGEGLAEKYDAQLDELVGRI